MKYRPDIDGLRAVAVLSVVLFHLHLPYFSGGYIGVDVFFVISGYLITGIIWREISAGEFSLVRFYERRARRILPALFAVILFSSVLSVYILTPEELSSFAVSVIGSIFFFQNFVLGSQAGYFDAVSETKPLLHIWSLAVEEQFYIFFPLVLLFAARWMNRRSVTLLIVAAIGISLTLSCLLMFSRPVFNFYMLPLRAWELLVGSLLAITAFSSSARHALLRDVVSVLGLLSILLPVVLYTSETPFPGYTALPPVIGAAALIWAGKDSLAGRMLSFRPVVFIGLISYSLYLWHWPLFAFYVLALPGEATALHMTLLLLASMLLAVLSWRYIETPFRRSGRFLSDRRSVFVASGGVAAVLTGFAVLIVAGGGWSWRAQAQIIALADVAMEKRISDAQCRPEVVLFTLRGRDRGFCPLGQPTGGRPDVLVWGDSHVGAWFPLLDEAFRQSGTSAYAISMAGCPIAFGLERAEEGRDGCTRSASAIREYIQNEGIEHVLIVGSWFGALSAKNTIYNGVASHDDETRLANVTQAIAGTGDILRDLGVTSGFMMTVPGARHSVPEAAFRQARFSFYPDIRRTAEEYRLIMEPIQAIANSHFDSVITTHEMLCASGFCDIIRDGHALYYDSNHPSLYLNEVMLPQLQTQIEHFSRH